MVDVSVARGDLKDEDLALIFLAILELRDKTRADAIRQQYSEVIPHIHLAQTNDDLDEHVAFLMDDLLEALNEVAPDGYFFGVRDRGTDFGFFSSIR